MPATKSKKLQAYAVILENAQATLPAPSTASDGADIQSWRTGGFAPDYASIAIDASAASTLGNPVTLYGYDLEDAQWRSLGVLNGGADISLTTAIGFEQRVRDVGVFERLALSAASVSAGNITVIAKPIEVIGN